LLFEEGDAFRKWFLQTVNDVNRDPRGSDERKTGAKDEKKLRPTPRQDPPKSQADFNKIFSAHCSPAFCKSLYEWLQSAHSSGYVSLRDSTKSDSGVLSPSSAKGAVKSQDTSVQDGHKSGSGVLSPSSTYGAAKRQSNSVQDGRTDGGSLRSPSTYGAAKRQSTSVQDGMTDGDSLRSPSTYGAAKRQSTSVQAGMTDGGSLRSPSTYGAAKRQSTSVQAGMTDGGSLRSPSTYGAAKRQRLDPPSKAERQPDMEGDEVMSFEIPAEMVERRPRAGAQQVSGGYLRIFAFVALSSLFYHISCS
jgi:hypothetical protein